MPEPKRRTRKFLNNPWEFGIPDPGNGGTIPGTCSGTVAMTSGGSAQTRTVQAPQQGGLDLTLVMQADGGGDITVTFPAGIDTNGNPNATFNDAADYLRVQSVPVGSAFRWRLVSNVGCALS